MEKKACGKDRSALNGDGKALARREGGAYSRRT